MKMKLFKIISVIGCIIFLMSIAGCEREVKYIYMRKEYPKQIFTLTVFDSNDKEIYGNYAEVEIEVLSLDEEYYITVKAKSSTFTYDEVHINYDRDCMEILPLPDHTGEVYSLRGLKECSECFIDFYYVNYYLDWEGNKTTTGIVEAYGSILVSFS